MNNIVIDKNKCTGCGLCKRACPAMLLDVAADGKAACAPVDKLNWYGCWKCQHCMAVCPAGAISVMGKNPEDSLPMWPSDMGDKMDRLVAGRTSCRHFKQENVDPDLLDHILNVLTNTPTGGNKMMVEYTVIDDVKQMNYLKEALRKGYYENKAKGLYPYSWDEKKLGIMESREDQAMNGDMFFCSAPHLFIPHMPKKSASAPVDTSLTLAYFELLAQAHGLGTIYLGYAFNVMRQLPEVKAMLGVPEDHFMVNAVGFGYPEFTYARGRKKDGLVKVHELKL